MPSITTISIDKLARLVGTPHCPALVDVRADEDYNSDPRLIPSAIRRSSIQAATGSCANPFKAKQNLCPTGAGAAQLKLDRRKSRIAAVRQPPRRSRWLQCRCPRRRSDWRPHGRENRDRCAADGRRRRWELAKGFLLHPDAILHRQHLRYGLVVDDQHVHSPLRAISGRAYPSRTTMASWAKGPGSGLSGSGREALELAIFGHPRYGRTGGRDVEKT
jgi:hypothetical protein